MALIDERSVADAPTAPRGFRPSSRRRTRMVAGVALAAIAIGGNLAVYSSVGSREPVLQVVRDVPAGQQLTADDLREVEVAVDSTVRTIRAGDAGGVIGQYARVRLVSGSLLVGEALQVEPLVSAGAAVVAIQVPEGALPIGLRERSRVRLVIPPPRAVDDEAPVEVIGRVVGLPSAPQSVSGRLSLSVEVDESSAATVVASDDVRVVLLDPREPANETEAGS